MSRRRGHGDGSRGSTLRRHRIAQMPPSSPWRDHGSGSAGSAMRPQPPALGLVSWAMEGRRNAALESHRQASSIASAQAHSSAHHARAVRRRDMHHGAGAHRAAATHDGAPPCLASTHAPRPRRLGENSVPRQPAHGSPPGQHRRLGNPAIRSPPGGLPSPMVRAGTPSANMAPASGAADRLPFVGSDRRARLDGEHAAQDLVPGGGDGLNPGHSGYIHRPAAIRPLLRIAGLIDRLSSSSRYMRCRAT